jgi:hypothetical protein
MNRSSRGARLGVQRKFNHVCCCPATLDAQSIATIASEALMTADANCPPPA